MTDVHSRLTAAAKPGLSPAPTMTGNGQNPQRLLDKIVENEKPRLLRRIGRTEFTEQEWDELTEVLEAWRDRATPELASMSVWRLHKTLKKLLVRCPAKNAFVAYLRENDLMPTNDSSK